MHAGASATQHQHEMLIETLERRAHPIVSPKPAAVTVSRNRSRSARAFDSLQFLNGGHLEVTASAFANRQGFIVCLQTDGSGAIAHSDTCTSIASGEAFVIARPHSAVWRPVDPSSRCIIATGGPAFSLRFKPAPVSAVKLDSLNPITLLLKEFLELSKTFEPAADPGLTRKLAEVLADLADTAIGDVTASPSIQEFVAKLARAEPYLNNPEFDPPALADECGVTLRVLQKQFRRLNTTPRKWILERRLEHVRKKLDDRSLADLTIEKLAARSGLRNIPYFTKAFKEAFGVAPGRYRRLA